jgi:hypothetical protein
VTRSAGIACAARRSVHPPAPRPRPALTGAGALCVDAPILRLYAPLCTPTRARVVLGQGCVPPVASATQKPRDAVVLSSAGRGAVAGVGAVAVERGAAYSAGPRGHFKHPADPLTWAFLRGDRVEVIRGKGDPVMRRFAAVLSAGALALSIPAMSSADQGGVPHPSRPCPTGKSQGHGPKTPPKKVRGKKCGFQLTHRAP